MTPRDLALFRECLLELGPTARSLALPKGYLNVDTHRKELQGHEGKIRQGESGSQASPDVGLKEDSSAEEQEAEGR